jgi:hypothetical protein
MGEPSGAMGGMKGGFGGGDLGGPIGTVAASARPYTNRKRLGLSRLDVFGGIVRIHYAIIPSVEFGKSALVLFDPLGDTLHV